MVLETREAEEKLWGPVGIRVGGARFPPSPRLAWNPGEGEWVPYEPVTPWQNPGESPLCRQGVRPAPRVLADRERGDARRRSCPLGRRPQRGSGVAGSGGLGEGCLAGSRRTQLVGSCLGSGQRLGDCRAAERLESRQVCSGHHASPAGAATCGKASRWGSRGWVARPAAPRRGSPSLSSGIGRYTPRRPRGNQAPSPPFLSGSHPPQDQRRVFPIHRTDPAVKARGCSVACLPGEAAKSPGDRREGDPLKN